MIKRTLKQLQSMIKVENNLTSFEETVINGVTIDSRKIQAGNLFVPLKGENADGHRFVEAALKNGAAASLWQSDVPNPPKDLPILIVEDTEAALQELARSYRSQLSVKVVGITGSNGKTTTKDMTAALLSLQYKVQKTEGNFNNHLGLPLTILGLNEDTEIAVLEMGMSGKGEIDFLTKLARPEAVVITNIGESHLQDLGSREGIAEAKLEILRGLQANGLVVYHGDEPLLQGPMREFHGDAKLQTFGRFNHNTVYPVDVQQHQKGSQFKINGIDLQFILPVLGVHNVLNALAAMLVSRYFGIPFESMNEGFSNLKVTNMRMELVEGEKGEKIINDAYNASPTSMKAAIDLVTDLSGYQKKIVVLGDMLELGEEEQNFHTEIGRGIDSSKVNFVFTYGNLGEYIAKGALENFSKERVFAFLHKEDLIKSLQNYTDESTLVLVKASRGMKLEEVVRALQSKQ
ncbi:UDP-N-acetylmuramoyl-tripeptide--D-alanyl-D-alanine ligase [Bacillus dakarensis]|uniref:UDP-N-acetylmuramoyl-tripeptide--D-alanyl-D- alanine ligase n=1 Tax=Robertmurraya dakarensis TaxID=1926278 RepID=UPI000981D3F8|nr:UDP-N-acetylmuramoyl-tripeptide--D-alanyl-D-alanine ligase [Bacillus dakarensis]